MTPPVLLLLILINVVIFVIAYDVDLTNNHETSWSIFAILFVVITQLVFWTGFFNVW